MEAKRRLWLYVRIYESGGANAYPFWTELDMGNVHNHPQVIAQLCKTYDLEFNPAAKNWNGYVFDGPYLDEEIADINVAGDSRLDPDIAVVGTSWCIRDVLERAEEMAIPCTPEQAFALLDDNEEDIQLAMIEAGNDVINGLLGDLPDEDEDD